MMDSRDGGTEVQAMELRFTSGVYPKRDLTLVRGEGARVFDAAGRSYIDCVAGIGSLNVGHAHPAVVAAVTAQVARLTTCPEIFTNDRRAELLQRLVALAPGNIARAFLCNSGTEAVEGAIKFARLKTGRAGIVAAMRGFHGRTLGALSATWEKKYREPFAPLVPGFSHVPYDDLEALRAAVSADTAGVLLEVVQGEGGVRPGSPEYLRGTQEICRSTGTMLILDEVQTGFGRTGRVFAAEHHGLEPDLMCVAKSMAGGLPMGAVLIGESLGEMPRMVHGSTMGGNPLACAAALATFDILREERLPERAARLGAHALARLQALPQTLVRQARGLGLFLGVELRGKAAPVLARLQEKGVLALPAGPTVLRLLPPLVISEADLETALAAVAAAISDAADDDPPPAANGAATGAAQA